MILLFMMYFPSTCLNKETQFIIATDIIKLYEENQVLHTQERYKHHRIYSGITIKQIMIIFTYFAEATSTKYILSSDRFQNYLRHSLNEASMTKGTS